MRVKPSLDMPGGQYVKGVRKQVYFIADIVAGIAAVIIVVAAIAVIGAAAAPVAAEGAAAIGGGAAGAGGGEVVSLAAYKALLAAPQVKTLAAAAGVLFVLGAVKNAQAASLSVAQVSAIRAVAVADFRPVAGLPSASTVFEPRKSNFIYTSETGSQKAFALGAQVLFDGKPHLIIGQFSAE
jgi:hypothetical protein